MAIDITREPLVDLNDYARLRPPGRNGRPMHLTTAYRHALHGVRGVRLETLRMGGKLYTSRAAIQRFLDAVSDPQSALSPGEALLSAQRGKQCSAATACDEAGRILARD